MLLRKGSLGATRGYYCDGDVYFTRGPCPANGISFKTVNRWSAMGPIVSPNARSLAARSTASVTGTKTHRGVSYSPNYVPITGASTDVCEEGCCRLLIQLATHRNNYFFGEITYLGAYLRPKLRLDGRAGSSP